MDLETAGLLASGALTIGAGCDAIKKNSQKGGSNTIIHQSRSTHKEKK